MLFAWFSRYSRMAKTMCAVECLLFVLLLATGFAIYYALYPFEQPLPYSVGLLTGCAISVIKIMLLEKTLARAVDLGKRAKLYAAMQALLRYFVTIAAVVPAFIFRGVFGVFGIVAGLLTLQLSAIIASAITAKDKREARVAGAAESADAAISPEDSAGDDIGCDIGEDTGEDVGEDAGENAGNDIFDDIFG